MISAIITDLKRGWNYTVALCLCENVDSVLKKERHHFADFDHSQSYGFSSSHVWMWEVDHKVSKELMLSNCDAGEDSWASLGLQEDCTSQS